MTWGQLKQEQGFEKKNIGVTEHHKTWIFYPLPHFFHLHLIFSSLHLLIYLASNGLCLQIPIEIANPRGWQSNANGAATHTHTNK